MDAVMSFAAARKERMTAADADLAPLVKDALSQWSADGDWYADLIEGASVLWSEIFSAEAPRADVDRFMPRFQEMLTDALSKTEEPTTPPSEAQVNRVTFWLSTATINNATYWGNQAHGGAGMRWVTMNDSSVRETHRAANGQVAGADGTFDIGGFELHYPGEPVGPPEVWINCRCILAPARVEGALSVNIIDISKLGEMDFSDSEKYFNDNAWLTYGMGTRTPVIIADAVVMDGESVEEDDMPTDELEDDEEEITEIPVHGVAAIEGRATGDGRKFAVGSVSIGAMPQPLGFEFESSHDGSNSKVAVIGRIDEYFKYEVDDIVEVRWRGVIMPAKPYAAQAIQGIIDGSYTGLSVIVDDIALDVEATEAEAMAVEDGHILPNTFSQIRIRRFDMVPTGAYQEGWINLGNEFAEELDAESLAACATCNQQAEEENPDIELGYDVYSDQVIFVNLGQMTEEDLERYDALTPDEQILFAAESGMIERIESYRDVSTKERRKLAKEGKALPDGSFPIANEEDLRNAIQAIGRASDPEAAKRLIKKRAKELGKEDLIPEDWSADVHSYTPDMSDDEVLELARRRLAEDHGERDISLVLLASMDAEGREDYARKLRDVYAPGTHDGPGWITHPIPTGRIRRYWVHGKGAAKIRWGVPGDFNRCRRQLAKYIVNPDWLDGACANMHKEALGVWPGQETGRRGHSTGGIAMALTAAAVSTKPAEAFKDPHFSGPTPITIEGDRIFGHLASWGVCHIGIQDKCVTAPHSNSNYSFYRTGVVFTDEGRVPVGQITMGTGHASIKVNAKEAVAHYDNTGSVVADVAAGEDAYGIWVAGILRPGLTDEQVSALAAAALSGDWRRTASGLELVAALAVNVPGFPIPRTALAASASMEDGVRLDEVEIDTDEIDAVYGISPVEREVVTASLFPSSEEIAGIVRTAVDEYRSAQARDERLSALRPFGEKAREHSLARIGDYFKED